MLSANENILRGLGLSYRKIGCIKELAKWIVDQRIDFSKLRYLPNEDVIASLTSIKGIGRWTAEMYLIFSLGRENVLSKGDGTIRRTIQWMYNLEKLPSSKDLDVYFAYWNQYATIVSAYMWKSIKLGLTQKSFDEAVKDCGS